MANKFQVGDPAPDFTLPAQTGKSVSLQDFRGQPVVLNSQLNFKAHVVEALKILTAMKSP